MRTPQAARKQRKSGNGGAWIAIVPACCMLVFMTPALFILGVAGMGPTWVALFVERGDTLRVRLTALMNAAGLIPFIGKLWAAHGSFAQLSHMAHDVYVWAIVYGAAGSAAVLSRLAPTVAAIYLDIEAARRVHLLEHQKAALFNEWGPALDRKSDAPAKP